MKKTAKLLSAVALSATLALGTAVPAFAADPAHDSSDVHIAPGIQEKTDSNELNTTNEVNVGQSKVQVAAEIGQLNAVIPLKVKVVATTLGGDLMHMPSGAWGEDGGTRTWVPATQASEGTPASPAHFEYAGFYRIENHSPDIDIRVVSIGAEVADGSKWSYSNTAGLTAATTIPQDKNGVINLGINGQNIDNADDGSLKLPSTDAWKVLKINNSNVEATAQDSALGLKITGSTSQLKNEWVNGIGYDNGKPAEGLDPTPAALDSGDEITLTYTIQIA